MVGSKHPSPQRALQSLLKNIQNPWKEGGGLIEGYAFIYAMKGLFT
jgi:hypothetical protein